HAPAPIRTAAERYSEARTPRALEDLKAALREHGPEWSKRIEAERDRLGRQAAEHLDALAEIATETARLRGQRSWVHQARKASEPRMVNPMQWPTRLRDATTIEVGMDKLDAGRLLAALRSYLKAPTEGEARP